MILNKVPIIKDHGLSSYTDATPNHERFEWYEGSIKNWPNYQISNVIGYSCLLEKKKPDMIGIIKWYVEGEYKNTTPAARYSVGSIPEFNSYIQKYVENNWKDSYYSLASEIKDIKVTPTLGMNNEVSFCDIELKNRRETITFPTPISLAILWELLHHAFQVVNSIIYMIDNDEYKSVVNERIKIVNRFFRKNGAKLTNEKGVRLVEFDSDAKRRHAISIPDSYIEVVFESPISPDVCGSVNFGYGPQDVDSAEELECTFSADSLILTFNDSGEITGYWINPEVD